MQSTLRVMASLNKVANHAIITGMLLTIGLMGVLNYRIWTSVSRPPAVKEQLKFSNSKRELNTPAVIMSPRLHVSQVTVSEIGIPVTQTYKHTWSSNF